MTAAGIGRKLAAAAYSILSSALRSVGVSRTTGDVASLRTRVGIVAAVAILVALFEAVKEALSPRLPSWHSHALTIVFATVMASLVTCVALPAYERLREAAAEAGGARDELREATRRAEVQADLLRTAIEQAGEGVVITDARGRIEYANPAAAVITGYSREELQGQNPRLLKSGRHDQTFYRQLWDTILAGAVWSGDITNRRKDGRLSVERTTIAPVRDDTGAITHFVGLKRDVTRRTEEEEALERIRYSIDNAADLVLWTDVDGRIVYANRAASRSLGYSPEEMLTLRVWDTNADITPQVWPALWARTKKQGTYTAETRRRRRDGTTFPVELSGTYLVFRGRESLCVIGRDLTERKRAEEALRASEERYRQLFQRNLAGVYRSTLEGRILECNGAFARMFGYESQEEALVAHAIDLYPSPEARSAFVERLRSEGSLQNYESEGRRRDGTRLHMLENAALVEGDVIEGTVIDVTGQKKLEEQFRQAQKMEAVGRLAGGVAHDFNNLLGVINGYSEMVLRKLPAADPLQAKVEQILKAGERAAGLTRQLLAFSRQQVLQPRVLDLNHVVTEMDKMLRRLIGEDVELRTRLAPDLGRVRADPGQLEQILMNLAVNARDAMPDGGGLTIETRNAELDPDYVARHSVVAPGPYVMLAMSDTGMGMDEDVQSRMFEPFFTTKERGRGTGLGLSTVYGIVKQSGGYIWVYSERGMGTTFKIYLPSVEDALEPPVAPAAPAVAGGAETVLVVEDESALRELIRETLAARGYTPLVARDGAEALQVADAQEGTIDLLITDVIMPGMTGRAAADALTAVRPGMKVLYISGYTDEAIVRHGVLRAGVNFLNKPFAVEALLRKVRSVLDA